MKHACHWPGCKREVAPKLWGCPPHWYTLPEHFRRRVWKAYRPGQEIDKKPSEEYLALAREIQEWISRRQKLIDEKRSLRRNANR